MFQNISVKEALKLALEGRALLIDLRSEKEYQEGHFPTAVRAGEEELIHIIKKEQEKHIILYCTYGNYSLKMARELSEEGYRVYSVVGGYHAYTGYVERRKKDIWTMEWKNS